MILHLTFAVYCFAHLGDIAASVWGWLCTPFSNYGGRHRNAFREPSTYDHCARAIAQQAEDVRAGREYRDRNERRARLQHYLPTYVTLETLANHGWVRLALEPSWRADSGELPVARISELAEVAT